MFISALNNMLDLLQPLSIYRITDGSFIMKELASYETGFSPCESQLETNINDSFIQTCSLNGLKIFEGACGWDLSYLSETERRQRLIYMLSVLPSSFDEDGIMTALKSVGFDGTLTIDSLNELIIFNNVESGVPPESYKSIISMAEKVLPAHLDYALDASAYTWAQIDAFDRTFFQIDSLGFRWNVFLDNSN